MFGSSAAYVSLSILIFVVFGCIYVGVVVRYRSCEKVAENFYLMAKSKKVASLIEKKRLISKEIDNLQNMCEHKNKVTKSIKEYEASSATVIRRICEDCNKMIGMPTQQEIFDYLQK